MKSLTRATSLKVKSLLLSKGYMDFRLRGNDSKPLIILIFLILMRWPWAQRHGTCDMPPFV